MSDCPVEVLQEPKELMRLIEFFKGLKPKKVLEVGSMYGGTLWYWIASMKPGKPSPLVVSVDVPVSKTDPRHDGVMAARAQWQGWAAANWITLIEIVKDSTTKETIAEVGKYAPYDFVFIDGGHDYQTVDADFKNYYPMLKTGGILAMHDISVTDENQHNIDSGRWWRELTLTGKYKTGEIITEPTSWGIGLVYKRP